MEREERESERLRKEVTRKCGELGIRRTRYLNTEESRRFLDDAGLIPASAVAKGSFVSAKRIDNLEMESSCMCCGASLEGGPCYIVELKGTAFAGYKTICVGEYEQIVNGASVSEPAEKPEPESTPAEEPAATPKAAPVAAASAPAPAAASAPADPVAEALKVLSAAVSTPKEPPVDKAKIIAEAVEAARDEAKVFMQKSIAEFIRGGAASAESEGESEPESSSLPAAKGDGVAAAEKASSWTAKATAPAKDAVEKLNKFLSEFSYFRNGVSMRLVNTFARAADKKSALQSYCEVSQMEDLPDLVEKMKSPEFKAVCEAFAALGKVPKPLNRRFAVFYGNPGGGKTFSAERACAAINGDGKADVVICHAGMDASDMLYAYRLEYATNKRGYVPTALLSAMVNGRAVVLDEVNTLPMEARMFLQDILDNKGCVHVMGVEIPIRDGFFVIGTMNPETGQGAQPLPLPLVDRAAVVREFRTSVSQAAVGAGLC